MSSVVSDIKKWIKTIDYIDRKTKKLYLSIVDDIEDYDYDYEYVNAPAAMGDTHKSSCSYKIGDFSFEYYHINGEGGLHSAKFTIEHKDQTETVLTYSEFAKMSERFGRKLTNDPQTALLDDFIKRYQTKNVDRYDYYLLFSILNAFTFGQAATIMNGSTEIISFVFD